MHVVMYRTGVRLSVVLAVLTMIPASGWAQSAGESTYRMKCTLCHGPDGGGSSLGRKMKVHDLRSPEVQKMSDADLTYIISNGKNNMPPFKNKLGPEQIPQVLNYLRELGKKK
jgi:mono/diheme cytochrome c family protein